MQVITPDVCLSVCVQVCIIYMQAGRFTYVCILHPFPSLSGEQVGTQVGMYVGMHVVYLGYLTSLPHPIRFERRSVERSRSHAQQQVEGRILGIGQGVYILVRMQYVKYQVFLFTYPFTRIAASIKHQASRIEHRAAMHEPVYENTEDAVLLPGPCKGCITYCLVESLIEDRKPVSISAGLGETCIHTPTLPRLT